MEGTDSALSPSAEGGPSGRCHEVWNNFVSEHSSEVSCLQMATYKSRSFLSSVAGLSLKFGVG
jgi:hypothetical protein